MNTFKEKLINEQRLKNAIRYGIMTRLLKEYPSFKGRCIQCKKSILNQKMILVEISRQIE